MLLIYQMLRLLCCDRVFALLEATDRAERIQYSVNSAVRRLGAQAWLGLQLTAFLISRYHLHLHLI